MCIGPIPPTFWVCSRAVTQKCHDPVFGVGYNTPPPIFRFAIPPPSPSDTISNTSPLPKSKFDVDMT